MNARKLTLATLVTLCTTLVAVVFFSAPALALEAHVFSSSFSGSGSNALSNPQGVAIDQMTGEVYVVDKAHNRVEIFSASGTFISAFGTAGSGNGQFNEPTGVAVDSSSALPGDVYVLDGGNERVEVFNARGEYRSQITPTELAATQPEREAEPLNIFQAITVDTAGNLWIYDDATNVYEFPSEGVGRFAVHLGQEVGAGGLAINSSGDLYALASDKVVEASPSGRILFVKGLTGSTAIAVDPVTQDLYEGNSSGVAHLPASSFGTLEVTDTFSRPGGTLVRDTGIAVRGSTGSVYVADAANNRVDIFNAALLPDTVTEAASGVSKDTGTLHGTVNPNGVAVSSCRFEYYDKATEAPDSFGRSAPCKQTSGEIGAGTTPVAVSAELSGLTPADGYEYRFVAANANGTNNFAHAEQFFALPAVDALGTGPVEAVTPSGAKFTGVLSPDGTDTHYYFQYGRVEKHQDTFGSTSPALPVDAGSGGAECKPPGGEKCSPVAASTVVGGLEVNTLYDYRLAAGDLCGSRSRCPHPLRPDRAAADQLRDRTRDAGRRALDGDSAMGQRAQHR